MLTTRHAPLERSGKITILPYQLSHFKRLIVRPHEETIKEAVKLSDTEWAQAIGKEAVEAYTGYIDGDIFGWINKSLKYMLSLQVLCERYNIPYKWSNSNDISMDWKYTFCRK